MKIKFKFSEKLHGLKWYVIKNNKWKIKHFSVSYSCLIRKEYSIASTRYNVFNLYVFLKRMRIKIEN